MKTVTAAQYYIRLMSGEIVVLDYQFDGLKDLVEIMENIFFWFPCYFRLWPNRSEVCMPIVMWRENCVIAS